MSEPRNRYNDYRIAKAEAAALATSMRFVLLQGPNGKPQVLTTTKRKKEFVSWLSAWSWLYQVWQDRQPRSPPAIPFAIMLE